MIQKDSHFLLNICCVCSILQKNVWELVFDFHVCVCLRFVCMCVFYVNQCVIIILFKYFFLYPNSKLQTTKYYQFVFFFRFSLLKVEEIYIYIISRVFQTQVCDNHECKKFMTSRNVMKIENTCNIYLCVTLYALTPSTQQVYFISNSVSID